jgi:anaphase-promoting complex subunit 2
MKNADTLTILVNIYESKEIFMEEYRTILGDRLLKSSNLNLEDELASISKLKTRFGHASISSCDAMIYDIQESQKLNAFALSKLPPQVRRKN